MSECTSTEIQVTNTAAYILTGETVYTLTCLRAAAQALKDAPIPSDIFLWLLPTEWHYFAKYGWIKRVPDGRTIITQDCPACPAGIEVKHRRLRLV